MRRFTIITACTAGICTALAALRLAGLASLVFLLPVLLAYVAVLVYGASSIRSQVFLRTVCHGDRSIGQVAITFDDGPAGERTGEILGILERHRCPATFFLIGRKIAGNETLLKELVAAGHSLGSHSFSHSGSFPLYSGRRIAEEIRENGQRIEAVTGMKPGFFRPPFGVTNPRVYRGVKASGLTAVGWSRRSFDTRNEDPGKVIRRITRRLRAGDIILLHETSRYILEILEGLLPEIRQRGLECVSLDRMMESM
jgi:peptidoglycan/xylan/chitin deacetylase (PgdA/CDA1 family)